MVINLLDTNDLLELSLLKCKACKARLQSPIMHFGISGGNVCGSCCDTDAVRNEDLEALLKKLYFPCNYAEGGCNFQGSFDDVCNHEKRCVFRRQCPLVRDTEVCEKGSRQIDDIIDHIKSEHPDNVLTVVENQVSVRNPTASNQDVFYLLLVNELHFILRGRFNTNQQCILYKFYCLNYNMTRGRAEISILLTSDKIFNVASADIDQLPKGEFPYVFNAISATKIKLATLENSHCLDNIVIKIYTRGYSQYSYTQRIFGFFVGLVRSNVDCPFTRNRGYCIWRGGEEELFTHLKTEHINRVNQNNIFEITVNYAPPFCLIKDNNAFIQTYEIAFPWLLVTTRQLRTGNLNDRYMWQIYFKHPKKGCETVISDICVEGEYTKTIGIEDYRSTGPFRVKVVFTRINTAVHQ